MSVKTDFETEQQELNCKAGLFLVFAFLFQLVEEPVCMYSSRDLKPNDVAAEIIRGRRSSGDAGDDLFGVPCPA